MARHPELVMFLPRKDLADWQRDQDMYRTTAVSFRTCHWNIIWIIWLLYLDESAFAFMAGCSECRSNFSLLVFRDGITCEIHERDLLWWEPAGKGRSSRSHSSRNTSHKPNPAVRKFLPKSGWGTQGPCSCEYILTYFVSPESPWAQTMATPWGVGNFSPFGRAPCVACRGVSSFLMGDLSLLWTIRVEHCMWTSCWTSFRIYVDADVKHLSWTSQLVLTCLGVILEIWTAHKRPPLLSFPGNQRVQKCSRRAIECNTSVLSSTIMTMNRKWLQLHLQVFRALLDLFCLFSLYIFWTTPWHFVTNLWLDHVILEISRTLNAHLFALDPTLCDSLLRCGATWTEST